MNTANSLGQGFNQGLTRGLQYGQEMYLREQMRQQQLADRAAALQLDAEIRAAAQARDDARYRDQLARYDRADRTAQRRADIANPAASLAFLRADAQGGPLTAEDATREQALTPLAFQDYQREEQARTRQAELDAAMREERQARRDYTKERTANEKAGRLGAAAAGFVDNSRLGQAMGDFFRRKPADARPQMDTVTVDVYGPPESDGTRPVIGKRQMRVPAGSPIPGESAGVAAPALDPSLIEYKKLSGKDQQALEAKKKQLQKEREDAEKLKKFLDIEHGKKNLGRPSIFDGPA